MLRTNNSYYVNDAVAEDLGNSRACPFLRRQRRAAPAGNQHRLEHAAEIYLHGAHVTSFQRKDQAPVLFMSQLSRFSEGIPIRGGMPVIFPWFGPREGKSAHGFACLQTWDLREVSQASMTPAQTLFPFRECFDHRFQVGQAGRE
jgi:D-hexose-6-phosphate mutarotase